MDIGYCVTMFCSRLFGKSKSSFIQVSRVSCSEKLDSEELFILFSFVEMVGAVTEKKIIYIILCL